ncbi:MAG: nitroreductase family protein [Candidatus Bipolaricaulota bacterium]|nr:nitroreductase family protein [Candidatus Bipolaricaulota bacterium]
MQENEVLSAIRDSISIFRFQKVPIPDEQLETILEAGRWAPQSTILTTRWKRDARTYLNSFAMRASRAKNLVTISL